MLQGNLKLIEKGFFQSGFGQAGMFDQQGNRHLAIRMMIEVDLYGVSAINFMLRRNHSGRR